MDRARVSVRGACSCGGEQLRQRWSVDQFHDERRRASGLVEAVHLRDARMVQRCEHLRFTLEAGQTLGIRGQRGRQYFDGDLAVEPHINRTVDLAHPAGAEHTDDLVGADPFRE